MENLDFTDHKLSLNSKFNLVETELIETGIIQIVNSIESYSIQDYTPLHQLYPMKAS